MSKYIISLLCEYTNYDDEVPTVHNVVSLNRKPTLKEAHSILREYDDFDESEWATADDETWELYNEDGVRGDPFIYCIKIQTPKQHSEMVNNWIEYIKLNTTPRSI